MTVHPPELREPVPLSLHHLPLPVSFAVFGEEGELLVVDPSLKEEAAAAGTFVGGARSGARLPTSSLPPCRCLSGAGSGLGGRRECPARATLATCCMRAACWPAGLDHQPLSPPPPAFPSAAVTQNAFGELCALQKVDGFGLTPPQILNCIRLAAQQVGPLAPRTGPP